VLPAVQSAREAGRRAHCSNNLRQIGLALASYESLHRIFPGVTLPSNDRVGPSGRFYSAITRLLPQLEQGPLFDGVNFHLDCGQPEELWQNLTVMNTLLAVVLCPSDPDASPPGYGRTNVHFSSGPTPWFAPGASVPGSKTGPFTVHTSYRTSDFTDGLSQTIGASERIQGDWTEGVFHRGDFLTLGLNEQVPRPATPEWVIAVCDRAAMTQDTLHESRGGETWFYTGVCWTTYNHTRTPNHPARDCSPQWYPNDHVWRHLHDGIIPARSHHPGGVNALLMDGSVRFFRDGIDVATWRSLSTRAGGELVPAVE
jgi:prepilin-type processing-associated H-X9-DG protein